MTRLPRYSALLPYPTLFRSFMLSLEVPEDELVKRLTERGKTSGRDDDNLVVIKKRLNEYKEKTLHLIDFYKERGKYISINGVGKIDRKSTRLNSSHTVISYAVFCLKKQNNNTLTEKILSFANNRKTAEEEFQPVGLKAAFTRTIQ